MRKRIVVFLLLFSLVFLMTIVLLELFWGNLYIDGCLSGAPIEIISLSQNGDWLIIDKYDGEKNKLKIISVQDISLSYKKRISIGQSVVWKDKKLIGLINRPNGLNAGYSIRLGDNEYKRWSLIIVPQWEILYRNILFAKKYYISLKSIKVKMGKK